jgi:RecB family exonuclease
VEYKKNDLTGNTFFTDTLLSLPQKPNLSTDLGNVFHGFIASYLNEVCKAGSKTEAELISEARDALAALDHPQLDLRHLEQRFDLLCQYFLPPFTGRLGAECCAEQSFTTLLNGVPLTGRIDLLIKDQTTQTLTIYDYKTGTVKRASELGSGYLRQLQFYKLLLENKEEFAGWKVVGGADIYVEPDTKNNFALAPEEFIFTGDEESEHLQALIAAVWNRLQSSLIDTSDFLLSEELAVLKAQSVYKTNSGNHQRGDLKEPSTEEYQRAYEQWLIADYHRRTSA